MRLIAVITLFALTTSQALAQVMPPIRFYHHDAQGNLIAMTDAQAQVVWRSEPAPFADYTRHPLEHPQRFLDQPQEPDGLFEIGARWYDPKFGRFMTTDSLSVTNSDSTRPQALNRYAYALNNPYRFHDDSGHIPVETALDVIDIGWSTVDLWNEPSWANAGLLVWSIGATFIPYIPGAWAGKTVKYGNKVADATTLAKKVEKVDVVVVDVKKLTIRGPEGGKGVGQQVGRENRIDWLEVNEFDPNQPKHVRGWLKNERRSARGPARNPPGYVQSHGRTTPAREGFDYSNSRLNLKELNDLEERIRRRAGRQ